MSSQEHQVAIVSFEGALKREIKRVRNELKKVEDLSEFCLRISAAGRINDGEVNLTYTISENVYSGDINGDSVNAVIDEFMRRHGWKKIHQPKALSYEKIPSEDTQEDTE